MVLSEAEAERKLAALRQEREALDRAIADLTLYLELGRRLTATAGEQTMREPALVAKHRTSPVPDGPMTAPGAGYAPAAATVPVPDRAPPFGRNAPAPRSAVPDRPADDTATTAPPRADPAEGVLSEGVLARRYGRALIEAALSILAEAGRPLHASEILGMLQSRGFTLPGHDPVAALNTRLWKRSGPDGPLIRRGDAVYVLAQAGEA